MSHQNIEVTSYLESDMEKKYKNLSPHEKEKFRAMCERDTEKNKDEFNQWKKNNSKMSEILTAGTYEDFLNFSGDSEKFKN